MTEGKRSGLLRNLSIWKQRHPESRDAATHRAESETHLAIMREKGFILCSAFGEKMKAKSFVCKIAVPKVIQ